MQLMQIDTSLEKRWDDYVIPRTHTVTDLSGWRHVVEDSYGVGSYFLAVESNGQFAGALGLYEIRHPLFGHYLSTAVFSTDGGFYYESVEARDLLIEEARRLAEELNVDYLLIRSRDSVPGGFTPDLRYRTAILDLTSGAENIWRSILPGKTRNQVRRGQKEGFSVRSGHGEMPEFFDVFHKHMRVLGSPAHSKVFYQNVLKYLGEYASFIVVRDGEELAAGALLFEVNGTAMNYHTVSLRDFNRRCPNYFLYWHMIKEASERGNHHFDMGRSEAESSNLKFKKNWGAAVVDLSYNYLLQNLSDIPYTNPHNPKYRLPIAIWRKMPLVLTRSLGPWLIRGIA